MTALNKSEVRAAFASAAQNYQQSAVVQNEIIERLIEKLVFLKNDPLRILDLGCGPGNIVTRLRKNIPNAEYVGVDFALSMLKQAHRELSGNALHWVCADIEQLPFAPASCDVVMSASTLQWSEAIDTVFVKCRELLRHDGLFIFSTFGPDTLYELRESFRLADPNGEHINQFEDMHTLGDRLHSSGFVDVVMEVDRIEVLYRHPIQLMKDLRVTGANNHLNNRSKGLFGPGKMRKALDAYQQNYRKADKYPATYEVIYGVGRLPSSSRLQSFDDVEARPVKFYAVKP